LKQLVLYLFFYVFIFSEKIISQPVLFKDNAKWGIKEADKVLVKPAFDTVLNFDNSGRVCVACYKLKVASANKFIKTLTTVYSCNYLNKKAERLYIKTNDADTCSVFTLNKNSERQLNEHDNYFIVSSKSKKYLVDKNFNQPINNGYHEIYLTPEPSFIVTENKNEDGMLLTGLINFKEEQIIPLSYSNIKVNNKDSLIVVCGAGGGSDEIFDYSGKRLSSYGRHIDMATKKFVIHKIYTPKEHYILLNSETKEEKEFTADEILPLTSNEVLMRIKSNWFVFNLESGTKKAYKKEE
jgi:hypothetical protein